MKDKIHPEYHEASVICTGCNTTFMTGSTSKEIRVLVCSSCHPYYTGKQKTLDTEGRVDRFKRKYARGGAAAPAAATTTEA